MRFRHVFLLVFALGWAGLVRAEEAPAPADVAASTAPLRIGTITVVGHDVFDPLPPSHSLLLRTVYNTANAVHIVTKDDFILRDLLFKPGDPYDPELVAESERLVRARPIFRSVEITTTTTADGRVDVTVETVDVWSTLIRPSYGVAGSQQYYGLGVLENNLLGQGKQVGAFVFQDVDRRTSGVSYADPQLLGSRWTLNSGYGRDEKGREYEVDIDRPYFSSRVRNSAGGALHVKDDEDRLFRDDEELAKFQHATRDGRVYASHALEARTDRVRRVTLAYERQEDDFTDVMFRGPINFPLPSEDRVVSAVLVGFDYRNLEYRKFEHLFSFDRIEDENLGVEWLVEAGPSLRSLGATRDGAFGRAQAQKILSWERAVWFNHVDVSGRAEQKTLRDGVMQLRSELFLPDWREDNTASLRANWIASHNLDPENQYLLGGFNGLRAYRFRELAGANSAVATVENRTAIAYDWLRLVNVGWAVFGDAGAAWQRGGMMRLGEVKTDVGVGLRFSFTRGTDPGLIRADLAYALQDNESTSRLALNIGADIHFGEREPRKFEQ